MVPFSTETQRASWCGRDPQQHDNNFAEREHLLELNSSCAALTIKSRPPRLSEGLPQTAAGQKRGAVILFNARMSNVPHPAHQRKRARVETLLGQRAARQGTAARRTGAGAYESSADSATFVSLH